MATTIDGDTHSPSARKSRCRRLTSWQTTEKKRVINETLTDTNMTRLSDDGTCHSSREKQRTVFVRTTAEVTLEERGRSAAYADDTGSACQTGLRYCSENTPDQIKILDTRTFLQEKCSRGCAERRREGGNEVAMHNNDLGILFRFQVF